MSEHEFRVPVGRPITAQDVRDAHHASFGVASEWRQHVAEYLNRIARGDAGDTHAGDEHLCCPRCGVALEVETDPSEHYDGDIITGISLAATGPRAGDTAPDDEPRTDVFLAKLDRMVNEDRIDDPREVRASLDEAQATIRRFRARVAELQGENERLAEGVKSFVRTVDRLADDGNALADTVDQYLNAPSGDDWFALSDAFVAWRSAAGGDS